jgi:enoyl-CoA hydratase/carnithine racemase
MNEAPRPDESMVKTECHGSIVTIELNRPPLLNSLNLDMVRAIRDALNMAQSMDRCKCVVLLGAGDRAFCAGGDVKALARWIAKEEFGPAEVFFKE